MLQDQMKSSDAAAQALLADRTVADSNMIAKMDANGDGVVSGAEVCFSSSFFCCVLIILRLLCAYHLSSAVLSICSLLLVLLPSLHCYLL